MTACSGIEIIAAPTDPPNTSRISFGLKYAPIAPSEAWNIDQSTATHARTRPITVARSMNPYFGKNRPT